MTSSDASLSMVVVAIRMSSSTILVAGTMSRYLRTLNIHLLARGTVIRLTAHVVAMVIRLMARVMAIVITLTVGVTLEPQLIFPVAVIYLEDASVELVVTIITPLRIIYTTLLFSVTLVVEAARVVVDGLLLVATATVLRLLVMVQLSGVVEVPVIPPLVARPLVIRH